MSFLLSLTLVGPLVAATQASADSLMVMWDLSTGPVTGFVVYGGLQSGDYSERNDVGFTDTYVMTDAVPGQRYCFAVASYSDPSIEGPKSEEVCGFSNEFPMLTNPGTQTSVVGEFVTLQLEGRDPDGHAVSYSVDGLPSGLSLIPDAGFISGAGVKAGSYSVQATVSDGLLSAQEYFTWVMSAPESAVSAFILSSQQTVRRSRADIELTWSTVAGRGIDVYRDGIHIATTRNDGSYTETLRGSGTVVYQVCAQEVAVCSNTIVVAY